MKLSYIIFGKWFDTSMWTAKCMLVDEEMTIIITRVS
jgi:hypothetical protein